MLALRVIMLGLLIAMATADEDREYCSYVQNIPSYGEAAGSVLLAISISSGHRSDVIEYIPSTGAINFLSGDQFGIFPSNEAVVEASGSSFCPSTDTLHVADINGDNRDDLLCQAVAGTLTYKTHTYGSSFSASQTLDGFTCTDTIMIGDFNHDHTDDIMCVDPAVDDAVGAQIYFNQKCYGYSSRSRYSYRRRYNYYGYGHGYPNHHSRAGRHAPYQCTGGTTYTFPAGAVNCDQFANDYFVVADVNGDHRSDLVCHHAGGTVTYSIATGATSGTVFGSEQVPAPALSCAFATNKIIATDVDDDDDDDLVCVNQLADAAANEYAVSFYTGTTYAAFTTPPATGCIANVCRDAATATAVKYSVGDFNGDGAHDYLCRYEDGTPVGIAAIVYSVPM